MSTSFSRTLGAVEEERVTRVLVLAVAPVVALLIGWTWWMLAGEIGLQAVSQEARLEADNAVFAIHAPAAMQEGRTPAMSQVVHHSLQVGRTVEPGDILVVLDQENESFALSEAQARLKALGEEMEAIKIEIDAAMNALDEARRRRQPALAEARATYAATQTDARIAGVEDELFTFLKKDGHVSELEATRAHQKRLRQESQAESKRAALELLDAELALELKDREREISQLRHQLARLLGEQAVVTAATSRLTHGLNQKTVRAKHHGRIAEVIPLRSGTMISAGQHMATVIGEADLTLLAYFPPHEALGRIRNGQKAIMRLDGFPWSQYGVVEATVERVATEARDGRIRVEMAVDHIPDGLVGLEHGLPGQVEIELERLAPAQLLLRLAGRLVHASRDQDEGSS